MGDADDAQDEEYRRQEWVSYYVEVNDFAAARSLGWEGPAEGEGGDAAAVATAAGASTGRGAPPSSRRPPPVGSEDAATRIQAHFRGHAAAATYKEERNEAARLQWISYYIATRQYDAAREYGWDGTEVSKETESAATVVQKTYRGFRQRDYFKDVRDEESRQQWVAYYVRTGQIDKAAELGYEPPQALIPASGTTVPRLELPKPKSATMQALSRENDFGKQLTCYEAIADAFTPRKEKEHRMQMWKSAMTVQRHARGLLARGRSRLQQREELLYDLVNRQETRSAKRIEYYVDLLLSTRENNAQYHRHATTIQRTFRGKASRKRTSVLRAERDATRRLAAELAAAEVAEAVAAEVRRLRRLQEEAEQAEAAARKPEVSFAANARVETEEEILTPRAAEINARMSVPEINTELERGAHLAARQMAEKGRANELAARVMSSTRGSLKKYSPKSMFPKSTAHSRYFWFEGERLCWRKDENAAASAKNTKFLPIRGITAVLIVEPLSKHEFALQLMGLDKPYILKASSQQDMLAWVQALKTVLAVQQETGHRNRGS
mmetsp:Transcript_46531/g.107380  ORF Transcript_46531/g.107380 Transcript_46531/m.107380 type:complete len:553 (-) Transcript_46531:195-1853(-)